MKKIFLIFFVPALVICDNANIYQTRNTLIAIEDPILYSEDHLNNIFRTILLNRASAQVKDRQLESLKREILENQIAIFPRLLQAIQDAQVTLHRI